MFKRLKNIEGKIKGENKKESEPIKIEVWTIVLLKDELDYIFKNFNSTGKYFLIRHAKNEKKIDYNNSFLKINDASVVKEADFLEEIDTFYDLLIYFLDNSMRIIAST